MKSPNATGRKIFGVNILERDWMPEDEIALIKPGEQAVITNPNFPGKEARIITKQPKAVIVKSTKEKQ